MNDDVIQTRKLSRSQVLDDQGNVYNNTNTSQSSSQRNTNQNNNENQLNSSGASIPHSNDPMQSNDQILKSNEPVFYVKDIIKNEMTEKSPNKILENLNNTIENQNRDSVGFYHENNTIENQNNTLEIQKADIRALNFELHDIGEVISATKQHMIWHFTINGIIHKVELFDSIFTGRRRVKLDNQEVSDTGRVGFFMIEKYKYHNKIDDVDVDIRESDDCFLLYLNHKIFSELYIQEKQKQKEMNMSLRLDNKDAAKSFFDQMDNEQKWENEQERENELGQSIVWCDYIDDVPQDSNDNNLNDMPTPFD